MSFGESNYFLVRTATAHSILKYLILNRENDKAIIKHNNLKTEFGFM